jgi:hypothetical protein
VLAEVTREGKVVRLIPIDRVFLYEKCRDLWLATSADGRAPGLPPNNFFAIFKHIFMFLENIFIGGFITSTANVFLAQPLVSTVGSQLSACR